MFGVAILGAVLVFFIVVWITLAVELEERRRKKYKDEQDR